MRAFAGLAGLAAEEAQHDALLREARAVTEEPGGALGMVRCWLSLVESGCAADPEALLDQARALALTVSGWGERLELLVRLAPHFAEVDRAGLREEALRALSQIIEPADRVLCLCRVFNSALATPGDRWTDEALQLMWSLSSPRRQLQACALLAPCLLQSALQPVLALLRAYLPRWPMDAAQTVRAFAPVLSVADIESIRIAAGQLGYPSARAAVLAALVDACSGSDDRAELRAHLLQEATAQARGVRLLRPRGRVLRHLARHDSALLGAALRDTACLHDEEQRIGLLAAVADQRADASRRRAALASILAQARSIEDTYPRAAGLASIHAYLPPEEQLVVKDEALSLALSVASVDFWPDVAVRLALHHADPATRDELTRVAVPRVLASLAVASNLRERHLVWLERAAALLVDAGEQGLLERLLQAVMGLDSERERAFGLWSVGGPLSGPLLQQAEAVAVGLRDPDCRLLVSCALARPPDLRSPHSMLPPADDLLGSVAEVGDQALLSRAIVALSAQLEPPAIPRILGLTSKISSRVHRSFALQRLAAHLHGADLDEALEMLLPLSPYLPRPRFIEALTPYVPLLARRGGEGVLDALEWSINDSAAWYP